MKSFFFAAVAVLTGCELALAAVAWSTPAGNVGSYSYDSGQNANGLFGDGVASLDGFAFAPDNFAAAANGSNSPVTVADTASVVVHTVVPFWGVTVNLLGDYSILGTGTVDATGTITVTDLDSAAIYTLPLSMSNVPTSAAGGGFSGTANLVSVITSPSNARIELSATLTATADGNSTSLIQIKDAEILLMLAPEPAAIGALSLAGVMLRRSQR